MEEIPHHIFVFINVQAYVIVLAVTYMNKNRSLKYSSTPLKFYTFFKNN